MLLNESRLRAYLEGSELDAIVLGMPVSVAYATGHETSFETAFRGYMFSPRGGAERFFRSFAVIGVDGRAALVSHAALAATSHLGPQHDLEVYGGAGFDLELVEGAPDGMRNLAERLSRTSAERDPMEAVAAAVAAVAPTARRIGVEVAGLEADDLRRLTACLPANLEALDASVLIRLVRLVKTQDQIDRLTRSAEAAEAGLAAVVGKAAPEVTWTELVDVFRRSVADFGADVDHVALGPRGLGVGLGPYSLRPDDITMLDVGCVYRSCISDTGVTLALSPPDAGAEEQYQILLASIEAGAKRLRPGGRVRDVYASMRQVTVGTTAEASQPQGHGLGQEPKEAPFIGPVEGRFEDECVSVDADIALEADMVINLEIPFEWPGIRSFQVEKTFLVSESGGRPLINQPRDHIVAAGSPA